MRAQRLGSRCLAVLVASMGLFLIAGCTATPDISGWAQNSADLATATAAEGKSIVERLDGNYAQLTIGKNEGWAEQRQVDAWKKRRAEFAAHQANIDATMAVMARYADAIAKLAASGETGSQAADSIVKSAGAIVALVGKAHPISGAAVEAFKAFADIATKVQAQDSLADVMTKTDDEVAALANVVVDAANAQKKFVNAIRLRESSTIRNRAGPRRMRWYLENKGYRQIEDAFEEGKDVFEAAAVRALVSQLEPRYRAREEARVESIQWQRARLKALDAVAAGGEAWRKAHLEAATVLSACGGLRSLRFSCGNYTAANVKLAADRIRSIVAEKGPDEE